MQRFNRPLPIVLFSSAERVTIIRFFKIIDLEVDKIWLLAGD